MEASMAGDSPLAALVIDFAFATAEQRTQLMLIERMGAMEDRMHAAELRAERLANMLLMSGGTAFNIGRRALWCCNVQAGFRASSGDFMALTDLGPDLVERALARRSGPLYEHITHGEYDRSSRMEPLASYLELKPLGGGARALFVNDVDVGMLVVNIVNSPLIEALEELHEILEEDDSDGGPLRIMHSMVYFNRIKPDASHCFMGLISGSVPAPAQGKIKSTLGRYINENGIVWDAGPAQAIWQAIHRPQTVLQHDDGRLSGTGRTKSGHPTAENLSSVLGPPRCVS